MVGKPHVHVHRVADVQVGHVVVRHLVTGTNNVKLRIKDLKKPLEYICGF